MNPEQADKMVEQTQQVKIIKRKLEGWREVILPLHSILLWEKNYHPGLIFSTISSLFVQFWYLDPSFLTTISMIGLTVTLVDYLVPTITSNFYHPDNWTGAKEKKLEEICQEISNCQQCFISQVKHLYNMRNTRPKMYYFSVISTLTTLIWIGNIVNNLLLSYVFALTLLMLPGIKHHGLINKYLPALGPLLCQKLQALKSKQN